MYSPHFDICNVFSFNSKNHINNINILITNALWFIVDAFQSSKKVGDLI